MTKSAALLLLTGLAVLLTALQVHSIPWSTETKKGIIPFARDIGTQEPVLEPRRKHQKGKKDKKHKHHDSSHTGTISNLYNAKSGTARKSNPTDAFCKEFIARCYDVALQGKTQGKVQVVYSCKRNGDKYSKSYSFGCKVDGVVRTNEILGSTEGGFTVTVTTAGATEVITATATQEATVSSTSTRTLSTTETDSHTTSTTTTPVTSITDTTTSSTTITVASDVTATSVTTQTSTLSTTVTSTVGTTTATVVNAGTLGTFTLLQVAVPTNPPVKRVSDIDQSDFCSEFADGCVSVCQQRARSPARHIVCQQDSLNQQSGQAQYSLSCVCLNGKTETQHALAYAAEEQHIATVSTVATTTVTTTLQETETIPVEILTTQTLTSQVTNTATITSISTAFETSTIAVTQTSTTPTTIATTRPTSIVSTTTTTVSSVTATSTTETILAPTGAVEILDLYTGSSYGNIGISPLVGQLYGQVSSGALSFMAVQDPAGSDLIQLKLTDGSGDVWTTELTESNDSTNNLNTGSSNAAYQESNNGCNSAQSGPPSGSGTYDGGPCETFVFKLNTLDTTSPTPAFNLTGFWENSDATSASQAQQRFWDLDIPNNVLWLVGDPSVVQSQDASKRGITLSLVYLRFPVTP